MKNFGFSWMVKPPRGVRKGEAYAEDTEVFVLEGSNKSALIARAASPAFAEALRVVLQPEASPPADAATEAPMSEKPLQIPKDWMFESNSAIPITWSSTRPRPAATA